jgi:hypothetical protein
MALNWRRAVTALASSPDVDLGTPFGLLNAHGVDMAHGVIRPRHDGPISFEEALSLGPTRVRDFGVVGPTLVYVPCGCAVLAPWDTVETIKLYASLDALHDDGFGLGDDWDDDCLLRPPSVYEWLRNPAVSREDA